MQNITGPPVTGDDRFDIRFRSNLLSTWWLKQPAGDLAP